MSDHFLVEIDDDSVSSAGVVDDDIESINYSTDDGNEIDYDSNNEIDDLSFILILHNPTYLKILSQLSDPYNIIGVLGEKSIRLCGISSNVNRIISIEIKDFEIQSSDNYDNYAFPLRLYGINLNNLHALVINKDNDMIKLSQNNIGNNNTSEYEADMPPYIDMLKDITGKGVYLYDTCRYIPSASLYTALTKLELDLGSSDIDVLFSLDSCKENVSIVAKDTGDCTICNMNLLREFNHKKTYISNNYQLSDIIEIFRDNYSPFTDNIYLYIGKSLPLVIKKKYPSYSITSIIV